jgi:hypothetical protein
LRFGVPYALCEPITHFLCHLHIDESSSLALKLVFFTDKPIQTPEIPPEDIDPQNESHIHEGNIEVEFFIKHYCIFSQSLILQAAVRN